MAFAYDPHRRFVGAATLLLLAASVAMGCGSSDEHAPATKVTTANASALRFEVTDRLQIRPSVRTTVVLLGPTDGEAKVWLDGDYRDAALDRGAVSLAGGRGELTLIAPSEPATFVVHARSGGTPA